MWRPDRHGVGLLAGVAVALVATSPVQAADDYVLGVCKVARPESGADIYPVNDAGSYLVNYHGNDPRYRPWLSFGSIFAGAKITVTEYPDHGDVRYKQDDNTAYGESVVKGWFRYTPDEGYIGRDRFVMQVEKDGIKVRIRYLIESIHQDEADTVRGEDWVQSSLFCNPESWKINTLPAGNANLAGLLPRAFHSLPGFADLSGSKPTGQNRIDFPNWRSGPTSTFKPCRCLRMDIHCRMYI